MSKDFYGDDLTSGGALKRSALDRALDDIARRSFYEAARVVPVHRADDGSIVGYVVEDEHGTRQDEDWTWTYDEGLEGPDVDEHSRLHDAAEIYTEARHIRYNLPGAVEALEFGHSVVFAYAVPDDASLEFDEDTQEWIAPDGERFSDNYAGWILTATIEEETGR